MTQLPRFTNYGEYSSENYGVNTLRFDIGNVSIWYSYQTPVAFSKDGEFHIRENDWNVTTGKHLNWIDRDHSKRIPGNKFEKLLAEAVAK